MAKLRAKLTRDHEYIHLKIRKDDFEAFCSAAGLFKDSFLRILGKSEKDLKEGRYTSRKTLAELINA
ncbi:MAG: hypothetical protein V2B13_00960 [Pseudomonadota bacterium]